MLKKSFTELVFTKTKLIPRGKVSTYKLLAKAIGNSKAARAVGNALNKNRDPKIPCHRVVCSDGTIGGFRDGAAIKIKILRKEGIKITNGRISLKKYLLRHQKVLIVRQCKYNKIYKK